MPYDTIVVERDDQVAWITLDRPESLNAINSRMVTELRAATKDLDTDPAIGCIVITGSPRAFAAGADIEEMQDRSYADMYLTSPFDGWDDLSRVRTPMVAAVSGFALGGGCELAMMCDVIVAAESARFGQPETGLGVIPGIGGTQRLPRAVGRYKASYLVLTGRTMTAVDAERAGLVSLVVADAELHAEAGRIAAEIAARARAATYVAKDALQASQETPLAEGLRFERQSFAAAFAFDDSREGMRAFREKRDPSFTGR